MIPHPRFAVERDGQWLLPKRHLANLWTKRSQNARLFIRQGDAIAAAAEHKGRVVPILVAAFNDPLPTGGFK